MLVVKYNWYLQPLRVDMLFSREPFVECFCNLRLTIKRYKEYWGDPVTKTLHSSDMRFYFLPFWIVAEVILKSDENIVEKQFSV